MPVSKMDILEKFQVPIIPLNHNEILLGPRGLPKPVEPNRSELRLMRTLQGKAPFCDGHHIAKGASPPACANPSTGSIFRFELMNELSRRQSMKRAQFAESKILLLRQDEDAASTGDDCCELGITKANDNWRERNATLTPSEVLMRQLEVENSQLQRIASDLSLNNERLRRKSARPFNSLLNDAD
jgi:hypothetical protein